MYSVCQFVFIHCIRPALKTAFNPYEFINNLNNKLFVFSTSVILIPPENYHPVHNGHLIIRTIIYSFKPNVKILHSVTFLIRKKVSCFFYTVEPPLSGHPL